MSTALFDAEAFGSMSGVMKSSSCLSDSEVLQLAQRFCISPAVVAEAYVVFRRYCAIEKQHCQRSSAITTMPGRSAGSGVNTRCGIDLTKATATESENMHEKIAIISVDNTTKSEKSGEIDKDGKNDHTVGTTLTKTSSPLAFRDRITGLVHVLDKETEFEETTKELVQEEVLGVVGLQQFLNDLNMNVSSLEVSDLIQNLNSDPIDFVLYKRQRSLEEAATESQPTLPGVSTRHFQSAEAQAKKMASSAESVSLRRNAENVTGSARKNTHIPGDISSLTEKKTLQKDLKESLQKNCVTFSQFLFILSHVVMDKENNREFRDAEISEVFNILDVNNDGSITIDDVQAVVRGIVEEGALTSDRDIRRLSEMNAEELMAALLECDIDDDGRVTLEDLRGVLLM